MTYTSVTDGKGTATSTSKYNGDLSSCSSANSTLALVNVNYLLIRARVLSPESNYEIVVNQKSQKISVSTNYDTDQNVIFYSWIIVLCSIWWLILTGICYMWRSVRCKRRSSSYYRKDKFLTSEIPYNRIKDTMNNMLSGKYGTIWADDSNLACTIWTKLFESNSNVHITNEWIHVFHSSCLEDWFSMISSDKELCCPNCGTITSTNSSYKESSGLLKTKTGRENQQEEEIDHIS